MLYLFQPLQQGLLRPGCASVLVRSCTGCFACLHVSVFFVGISALAHAERPMTPGGYTILAMTVTVATALATLSALTRDDLERT